MNNIYLKIKKAKRKYPWGRSCFFGEPDLTNDILDKVYEDEIFIAQINLEQFRYFYNTPLLPKTGILSFFIRLNDMSPIVRYHEDIEYNNERDSRVDFNGDVDLQYNLNVEYIIKFTRLKHKTKSRFLWENPKYNELGENEIVLLQYFSKDCLYLNDTFSRLLFVIDKESLLQRDYSQVRLLILH